MSVSASTKAKRAPLSDPIIIAVARLVDDAQTETREPSHSDIEFQIQRVQLLPADPKSQGQLVGKAKRVRAVLSWALERQPDAGEALVAHLVSLIRGCGGFRPESPNYVGDQAIRDAADAFRTEGYELAKDGDLRPLLLDTLAGAELTAALESYVRRARRGSEDAALVTGTSKDLLEATAAHVITEVYGSYPSSANFPTLLGQAFIALGLSTPLDPAQPNEPPQRALERSMYEVACAVNRLRNKQGTGHGRPWLSSVSPEEARAAVELMGTVSERLLASLKATKGHI